MQQFLIDVDKPTGLLVIYAKQADSMSRFFSVSLFSGGSPLAPPEGSALTVRFGAPGMPAGWYDTITEPDGGSRSAFAVDGNTITVELAEQALSTPGTNTVALLINGADGYQLASWNFALMIEPVPGLEAPEATIYYNALAGQVAQTLDNANAAAASAAEAAASAEAAQQVSQGAVGYYETPDALRQAHPTAEAGNWAIVGSTDTVWVWDTDTSTWKDSHQATDLSNYYTKAQTDERYLRPTSLSNYYTKAQADGRFLQTAPVQSVNGETGAVVLSAADVGARPDNWIPTAAQVGALPAGCTQIATLTTPDQIPTQSLACIHFDTASSTINDKVEDEATFTDYAVGDFYGLWMGQTARAYGTLFISSPRFNGYFWIAQVWNTQFVRFKKIGT